MEHLTDKRRVELMLIPYLFRSCIGNDEDSKAPTSKLKDFIDSALEYAFKGVPPNRTSKLARRVRRISRDIEGVDTGPIALASADKFLVYYMWFTELVDEGRFAFKQGSPLHALHVGLDGLMEDSPVDIDKEHVVILKARLLKACSKYGLFHYRA